MAHRGYGPQGLRPTGATAHKTTATGATGPQRLRPTGALQPTGLQLAHGGYGAQGATAHRGYDPQGLRPTGATAHRGYGHRGYGRRGYCPTEATAHRSYGPHGLRPQGLLPHRGYDHRATAHRGYGPQVLQPTGARATATGATGPQAGKGRMAPSPVPHLQNGPISHLLPISPSQIWVPFMILSFFDRFRAVRHLREKLCGHSCAQTMRRHSRTLRERLLTVCAHKVAQTIQHEPPNGRS